jgi:hypothetical protein
MNRDAKPTRAAVKKNPRDFLPAKKENAPAAFHQGVSLLKKASTRVP